MAEAILKHFRDVKSKADEASGALPNSVYMAFRLRTLDLSDCGLHDQAVGEALPALLRENVPLDTLVLSQNMDVLPEAWAEFAKALAKNEELTLLALDYCRLGDANFVSLVSKGEFFAAHCTDRGCSVPHYELSCSDYKRWRSFRF